MFNVFYFTALTDGSYGDCGRLRLKQEHRPIVGDLVPTTAIIGNDPPWNMSGESGVTGAREAINEMLIGDSLLQIDHVLYAGRNVFHAYCSIVAGVKKDIVTGFDGQKNEPRELLYHYIEQANSFHPLYAAKE